MLCDIDRLGFLVFGVFFERDEKCVCRWAGWLAGCVCSLVWPIGISDRIFGRGNF